MSCLFTQIPLRRNLTISREIYSSFTMEKLTILFVALFVSSVVAAPGNLLKNLKSLEHVKRSAKLLKPFLPVNEEKKSSEDVDRALEYLDLDGDNMVDYEEIKVLLILGGATPEQIEEFRPMVLSFDNDGNKKLDRNELEALATAIDL